MRQRLKSLLKKYTPWLWTWLKWPQKRVFPVPLGLWLLNTIVQRVFRVNGDVPWMVHYTSRVLHPGRIEIGEGVWFSFAVSGSCYIQGANGVTLGSQTIFAPGVKVISANHDSHNLGQWEHVDPIEIGKHCWIGANAVILPGVKLGDGCVVGAGAVVTRSFPAGSTLVGVPARRVDQATVREYSEK